MNMIAKSINERHNLSAHAYNTLKDFEYLKDCPKQVFNHYRVKVMQAVSEYRRLRACYDNYQDKNTLDNDKAIDSMVRKLNNSTYGRTA